MADRKRRWPSNLDGEVNPHEIAALLDQLCVRLVFCLPNQEVDRLAASPPRTVEEFTNAVFVSEGLDPVTADRYLWNQVRDMVGQAFESANQRSSYGQ